MAINFGDLNAENIGTWPKPVKAIAIGVLCVAIIIAGYMLDIKAKQEELHAVALKEEKLKKKFKSKYKIAANLEGYRVQMKTIQEYFGAMLRQLPESTEVPGLVEDISHVGLANGLIIRSIKLKSERQKDFYTELPIEIIVAGGYHNLGQFVSDVAALPRIVTLHDFNITLDKKASGDGSMLKMKVLAKTYRYTAEDEGDDE